MFDRLVPRYDLLNDLMSFGLDRWWRRRSIRAAAIPEGGRVLDLGCGTGRLGRLASRRACVTGIDLSDRMLARARRDAGGRMRLVQGSAFRLPFRDAAFDAVVSGFLLRNLDDLSAAFAEMARVVRPGGTVALVDATEPASPALRRVFDAYFRRAAPALGAAVGRREDYRYLVASLAQIPPAPEVRRMLREAGFRSDRSRALTGGAVTLFSAIRSD